MTSLVPVALSHTCRPVTQTTRSRLAATAVLLSLLVLAGTQWWLSRPLQNDAFVDEATYIVTGQLWRAAAAGGDATAVASYLSGAPHLYPQLASLLFERGGLEAVRAFSFGCMVIAMIGVYFIAHGLLSDRVAGLAASAMFILQAPVQFLSRFATYDALCVALLAVALAVAMDRRARMGWMSVAVAGACIGAASVIKYAALLYLPCVVLVAALVGASGNRLKRGLLTAVVAGCTVALLGLLGQPSELWTGFLSTTLARRVTSGGRAVDLVLFAASLGGAAVAIAIPALMTAPAAMRWAAITMFVWALLAPLNHVRLHEFVSLHKHMAFGAVLVSPLAGGALAALCSWLQRRWEYQQTVIAVGVASATLAILARAVAIPGVAEAQRLYQYWPNNTRKAYRSFAPLLNDSARFLSEEPDLGTLYLGSRAPVEQWVHPYFFDYDGQRARKPADTAPYRLAIRDGFFTAVLLRFGPQGSWATAVEEELLRSQPRYRLAAKLPFTLADGPGAYQLWVRADAPGAALVH